MQGIGNQPDAKNQLNDDGYPGHQKAEIQAEEMVTVNVNLELVHIENLQYGRRNKDQSKKDFQRDGSNFLEFVHV